MSPEHDSHHCIDVRGQVAQDLTSDIKLKVDSFPQIIYSGTFIKALKIIENKKKDLAVMLEVP